MIFNVHWPRGGSYFGCFGPFAGPTMGLLSIYLPERSDGLELLGSPAIDLKALDYGGHFPHVHDAWRRVTTAASAVVPLVRWFA